MSAVGASRAFLYHAFVQRGGDKPADQLPLWRQALVLCQSLRRLEQGVSPIIEVGFAAMAQVQSQEGSGGHDAVGTGADLNRLAIHDAG